MNETDTLKLYFGAVELGAASFVATYLPQIPSEHADRVVAEMVKAMAADPLARQSALDHVRCLLAGEQPTPFRLEIKFPGEDD